MRQHAPPPTKFGPRSSAQPKLLRVAKGGSHAPPPTQYGGVAAQTKPATRATIVHRPPPTRYQTAVAVQPKSACGCCSPIGVIQRMEGIEYFNEQVDLGVGNAINFAGQSLGSEVVRKKRSFGGEKDAKFLRNLSTFFWYVGKAILDDPDAEVETMYVNNRILVSANNPNTMKEIHKFILGNSAFHEFIRTDLDDEASDDPRGLRTLGNFHTQTTGPDTSVNSALVLQSILFEKCSEYVQLATVRRSGMSTDVITAPEFDNKMILVNGLPLHAEQKLLLALVSSSLPKTAPVVIRGKKRPCLGCWLCLTFVKEVMGYTNLDFNMRPGKAWKNAISSLDTFITFALKKKVADDTIQEWAKQKIDAHKKGSIFTYISANFSGTGQDQGYDTGSEDESH